MSTPAEEDIDDPARGSKEVDSVQRKSLLNGRDPEKVLINSDATQTSVDPDSLKKFFWLHRCNLGVKHLHVTTYYFAVLVTISFLVFINASAPFVLTTFVVAPQSQQGEYSGSLGFYNELVIISVSSCWGINSDKIGRRWTYVAGFFFMAAGFYLYPLATNFWMLVLFRIVYAVGAAASSAMITAALVLGDYVYYHDRGKASGLVGCAAGLGAVIAVFGYVKIAGWANQLWPHLSMADCGRIMFMTVTVIALISCFVLLFGLQRREEARAHQRHASITKILKEGLFAARNPIIALSYAAGFGARGDSIIATIFLSLWVSDEAQHHGMNPAQAQYRAGTVSGIAQTCGLVFAPVAGLILDRLNRVFGFVLLAAVAACGYTLVFFFSNALSWPIILGAGLIGCGEIGLVVASTALVAQDAPPEVRGSVSGFFGICGSLGILVATKLGGYLYDHWRHGGPFLVFGLYNGALVIFGLVLWISVEGCKFKTQTPPELQAGVTE